MEIREPVIEPGDILRLDDGDFNPEHVCLVTGVGAGIGRATAVAAAANGLTVVGLDIDRHGGQATVEMAQAHGGRMVFVEADLTVDADLERTVEIAAGEGAIRYAANIAGIQHIDPVEKFPMAQYDQMQRLMLRAPFYLSQLIIPHLKRTADGRGAIGNMSSVHGHITTMNKPVYNITKFGLRALSQSIAAEGEGKIRSFSVSVGYVATPLALKQIPAQAESRGISPEEVVSQVMMSRSQVKTMMRPIDVANLFLFGFSRFANYLVGGDLLFDGGFVLTY